MATTNTSGVYTMPDADLRNDAKQSANQKEQKVKGGLAFFAKLESLKNGGKKSN